MDRDEQLAPSAIGDTNIYVTPAPKQRNTLAPVPTFQPTPAQPIAQPVVQQQPPIEPQPQPQPVYVAAPSVPQAEPIVVSNSTNSTIDSTVNSTIKENYTESSSASQSHSGIGKTKTVSKVHSKTVTEEKDTPAKSKTTHHINWGGVIKGAAIVTAIAVAGVGLYYAGAAAAGWAMSNPAVSSIVASIGEMFAPVMAASSQAWQAVSGFVPHIPNIIGNGIASAFHALGFTHATASIAGAKTLVGGIAAGSGIAITATQFGPDLNHLNILHPHQTLTPATHDITVTNTVSTEPVHPKVEHGIDMNIANLQAAHGAEASHQAAELGQHTFHTMHHHNAQETADVAEASAQDNYSHDGNHNTHADHASNNNSADAPDVDYEHPTGKHAKRSSRSSWRDHLFGSPKQNESHTAAVLANRSQNDGITSRGNNYTASINADRAKLAAALDTPQV